MAVDQRLAEQARAAAEQVTARQEDLDRAREDFQRAVRALYLAGGSLREIADLLGLSHQRVHQLLDLPRQRDSRRGRQASVLSCSFCERDQTQVRKLIAGPNGVAICNDCVDLATRAARHRVAETDNRTSILPTSSGSCSFCGKRPGEGVESVELLTARADVTVCTECLDLCHEILAEEQRQ